MKENIRVLVVEDQALVAEIIVAVLDKHGIEVIRVCDRGEDALHAVRATLPDLILMDIHLAGKLDGVMAARMIRDEFDTPIIFLTEHTDQPTFEKAKRAMPSNYLAKPFNAAELVRAIDIAFFNANASSRRVPVVHAHVFLRTENQSYVKVACDEILYLKAARAYCELTTMSGVVVLSNSMNRIHEQVDNGSFLKVHRSYVVNVNRITGLNGNTILMGTKEVPVSREYREVLMRHLKLVS